MLSKTWRDGADPQQATDKPAGRSSLTPTPAESAQLNGQDLLTVPESAAHLRVSKSYLDKLRVYGGGPSFLRLGARKILYRRSDLDEWAASRRYRSTSEYETLR
jgi:predicted DNA-binding transcriptional regulator AlpA